MKAIVSETQIGHALLLSDDTQCNIAVYYDLYTIEYKHAEWGLEL